MTLLPSQRGAGDDRLLRVVVADDQVVTRVGIRQALERGGLTVVAEASSAPSAVAAALQHRPDLVLLDVDMPGGGLSAARALARELPGAAVVVLSAAADDEVLFEALRAGARGLLLKDIDPDRLPQALHGVLAGEAALPRALVARLVAEFRATQREPTAAQTAVAGLTGRERQVLDALARGLSTAQVAAELFVAPVTVRTHTGSLLRKLGVRRRADAVRLVQPD